MYLSRKITEEIGHIVWCLLQLWSDVQSIFLLVKISMDKPYFTGPGKNSPTNHMAVWFDWVQKCKYLKIRTLDICEKKVYKSWVFGRKFLLRTLFEIFHVSHMSSNPDISAGLVRGSQLERLIDTFLTLTDKWGKRSTCFWPHPILASEFL